VCCNVLQCVAMCCSLLHSSNAGWSVFCNPSSNVVCHLYIRRLKLQCVAVCCSVLQCVAVDFSWIGYFYIQKSNTILFLILSAICCLVCK